MKELNENTVNSRKRVKMITVVIQFDIRSKKLNWDNDMPASYDATKNKIFICTSDVR